MKRKKLRDKLFWASVSFMVFLFLFAVFGPMIPNGQKDPVMDVIGMPHQPYGSPHALLGTDEIGRSFMQRIAAGARISLTIGFTVQLINLTVGLFIGAVSTFGPKWVTNPLQRFTDAMFAFPDILLAILIISIMGRGTTAVVVALSITGWPSIARLTKTQLATLKEREYVIAARAAGASTSYLFIKHMLPQMAGIILAVSMLELAGTILAESTLSFLGIGVQSPDPSWGGLVNNARSQLNSYPMELLAPCFFLSATIFALNFIGDGLRNYFDPKAQG